MLPEIWSFRDHFYNTECAYEGVWICIEAYIAYFMQNGYMGLDAYIAYVREEMQGWMHTL